MDGGNDARIMQEQSSNPLRDAQMLLISRVITEHVHQCAPGSSGIWGSVLKQLPGEARGFSDLRYMTFGH
jgi:hypothetical protein